MAGITGINNPSAAVPAAPAVVVPPPPHIALEIEEPPAPPAQAIANPNPARPAWANRALQGLRRGGETIINNPLTSLANASAGILGIGSIVTTIYSANKYAASANIRNQIQNMEPYYDNLIEMREQKLKYTTQGEALKIAALILGSYAVGISAISLLANRLRRNRAPQDLQQPHLANQPITDVIPKFREHHVSSSSDPSNEASSSEPSFDWSTPQIFVDIFGKDRMKDISHLLNRVQNTMNKKPGSETAKMFVDANKYLDLLEKSPEIQAVLANNVVEINAACIDRAVIGFNRLVRSTLKDNYPGNMPAKDFILAAIKELAIHEANIQLITVTEKKQKAHDEKIKKTGKKFSKQQAKREAIKFKPIAETYLQIENLVLQKLREQIPALPYQIEKNRYGNNRTTQEENEAITKNIVKICQTPMEVARLLRKSPAENTFIEQRYQSELETITNDFRAKMLAGYEEAGKNANSMIEDILVNLEQERQQAINAFYAQIVRGSLRDHYPEDMPVKDFIVSALKEIAIHQADTQLIKVIKKKQHVYNKVIIGGITLTEEEAEKEEKQWTPVPDNYLKIENLVLEKLREKIPNVPSHIKKQESSEQKPLNDLTTEEERKAIVDEITGQLQKPMEVARLLRNSPYENAFMEQRYQSELKPVTHDSDEKINSLNVQRDKFLESKKGIDPEKWTFMERVDFEELDEHLNNAKKDKEETIELFYAQIIKDSEALTDTTQTTRKGKGKEKVPEQ